jgi:iodotyrosine deiodinase
MSDTERSSTLDYQKRGLDEMISRSQTFLEEMKKRRTVREFSPEPVPRQIIENCLLAAGAAPSGANQQPWHFDVVSSPEKKRQIRLAAEEEEREFYEKRATPEWLDALKPLGTDANKPFLEIAPYLIAIFVQTYKINEDASISKHYYAVESVGIATGILVTALHNAGLVTLTHTPSPMAFLNTILGRPKNERPLVLLVTGYPASNVTLPRITKKTLDEIETFHEE